MQGNVRRRRGVQARRDARAKPRCQWKSISSKTVGQSQPANNGTKQRRRKAVVVVAAVNTAVAPSESVRVIQTVRNAQNVRRVAKEQEPLISLT